MKKLLPILFFGFLLAACNTSPKTEVASQVTPTAQMPDTAGLAQFQQWKAQNELASATLPEQPVQQEVTAPVKEVTIIREIRTVEKAPVKTVKRNTTPVKTSTTQKQNTTSSGTTNETNSTADNGTANNGNGTASNGSTKTNEPVAKTEENKGWSNATKGAVIGGAGGAVIGAVINKKNRAAGAVIGGVLGGAVGYGLGKVKDKKEAQSN